MLKVQIEDWAKDLQNIFLIITGINGIVFLGLDLKKFVLQLQMKMEFFMSNKTSLMLN